MVFIFTIVFTTQWNYNKIVVLTAEGYFWMHIYYDGI